MGRLALWIGIAILVFILIRALGPGARERRSSGKTGAERAADGRASSTGPMRPGRDSSGNPMMIRCAHCGVHLPADDAVYAGGKAWCSAEHRDAGDAGRR